MSLLNPFGSTSSTSNASASNQNVGAQGNTAPVFDISNKGGSAKAGNTKTAKATATKNKKNGTATAATPAASPAAPSYAASPQISSSVGEQTNISVTTSDENADNNLASIASEALTANTITANNAVAANTTTANNALGLANNVANGTLQTVNNALAASNAALGQVLDFAEQNNTQADEIANNATQAGENFAALSEGANPNTITQPTQPITSASGSDSLTNLILLASVVIAAFALFKKP